MLPPTQTLHFEDLSLGMTETYTKEVKSSDVVGFAAVDPDVGGFAAVDPDVAGFAAPGGVRWSPGSGRVRWAPGSPWGAAGSAAAAGATGRWTPSSSSFSQPLNSMRR